MAMIRLRAGVATLRVGSAGMGVRRNCWNAENNGCAKGDDGLHGTLQSIRPI